MEDFPEVDAKQRKWHKLYRDKGFITILNHFLSNNIYVKGFYIKIDKKTDNPFNTNIQKDRQNDCLT